MQVPEVPRISDEEVKIDRAEPRSVVLCNRFEWEVVPFVEVLNLFVD